LEVGRSLLGTTGPIIASSVMLKIAADPGHPKQLRAAEAIANRVGLPEIQEVHVHRVDESLEAKIARIRHVAALLKIDVADLLGRNLAGEAKAEPKLIEGKVVSPGGDPGVVGK